MLGFIRKALGSWVVIALLVVLVIAFLITGVNDPFKGAGGGGDHGAEIASAGGRVIGERDISRAFDRSLKQAQAQQPGLSAADFVRLGGYDAVVTREIGGAALDRFADRLGLAASTRAVDGEIASIPAFQAGGKFDESTYRRLLAENRLSDAQVRDEIASGLLRRQLLVPAGLGGAAPKLLAEPYAKLLLEGRQASVLLVPPSVVKDAGAPSEAELTAYYAANRARFTLPERRGFRFALLDKGRLADAVSVPDADIAAYYHANPGEFGGLETRTLNQVVVQDEAAAKRIAAAAQGGQGFAAAARAAGFAPSDTALGSLTESALAAATAPEVARAAFALPRGQVTAPVHSSFGWHVVQVAGVTPAHATPQAAAAPGIRAKLKAMRADALLSKQVSQAEDALGGGQSFGDVAKTLGLTIEAAPPATSTGATGASGASGVALSDDARAVLPKAFALDAADGPAVEEIVHGQRFALIEPGKRLPPGQPPLADVRVAVAAAWTADRVNTRVGAVAAEIAKAASAGQPLASLAAARGLPPPQNAAIRRIQLSQFRGQVPPPVALIFQTPAGQARTVAGPPGRGWFVVKTDAIVPGDISAAPQIVTQARTQFGKDLGEELTDGFARAAEREVGVKRSDAAIAALRARLVTPQPAG